MAPSLLRSAPATVAILPLAAALTLYPAAAAAAQQRSPSPADRFEPVREMIRRAIEQDGVPSVAVAVAHNGRIVWEEAFGWADRERRIEATPHTMYSLASISKPMTATGLMVLAERGEIALDRPVNEYLGFGRVTEFGGDAAGATVRRVASHTAGLPLHYQFFYDGAGYQRPPMDQTVARYGVLVHPPGEVYDYSNLGYGILDHVIARVSGRSYADFMRTEVFLPLGLTRTTVDVGPGLEPYVAQRYDSRQQPIPFYTFDHPGGSAVYSSAHDVARFGMFHLGARLPDQRRILADSTRAIMQRIHTPEPDRDGYGLGWQVSHDRNGYRVVSHTGGMPGVRTSLAMFPSEDLVIAVLTNTSHQIPFQATDEIASILLPRYGAARAERAGRTPPLEPAEAFPPAELAGSWRGLVHTYDGPVPFSLVFQPDGDVHVALADQLPTLLARLPYRDGALAGRFAGRIATEEQGRHPHHVFLRLRLRDGRLVGQATALTPDEPIHYALTSYAALDRVAELPLPSDEAAGYEGMYVAAGALYRVRVADGRLLLEGRSRGRTLLWQGGETFVVAEEPTMELSFRREAGRVTGFTMVVGEQTLDAVRR